MCCSKSYTFIIIGTFLMTTIKFIDCFVLLRILGGMTDMGKAACVSNEADLSVPTLTEHNIPSYSGAEVN